MPHKKSPAGTNSNTKTYWRRVSQMAHGLVRELVYAGSNNSVTEIIAFVDPKATQAMHREAIKMAIQDCSRMEHVYTELTDKHREACATLAPGSPGSARPGS